MRLCQRLLNWFEDVDLTPLFTLIFFVCVDFAILICVRYYCSHCADTVGGI